MRRPYSAIIYLIAHYKLELFLCLQVLPLTRLIKWQRRSKSKNFFPSFGVLSKGVSVQPRVGYERMHAALWWLSKPYALCPTNPYTITIITYRFLPANLNTNQQSFKTRGSSFRVQYNIWKCSWSWSEWFYPVFVSIFCVFSWFLGRLLIRVLLRRIRKALLAFCRKENRESIVGVLSHRGMVEAGDWRNKVRVSPSSSTFIKKWEGLNRETEFGQTHCQKISRRGGSHKGRIQRRGSQFPTWTKNSHTHEMLGRMKI